MISNSNLQRFHIYYRLETKLFSERHTKAILEKDKQILGKKYIDVKN